MKKMKKLQDTNPIIKNKAYILQSYQSIMINLFENL